jgi:iron complex transport system ATP-binding protein
MGLVRCDGEVRWGGKRLAALGRAGLARVASYLAQAPTAPPGVTVRQLLLLGRYPHAKWPGIEHGADQDILRQTCAALEIEDLVDRPVEELSGGQRQLCHIGRALMQQPQVLMLDEPDTYLDLSHLLRLKTLLRALAAGREMAVVLASHDLPLAQAVADQAVLLSGGRVASSGPADVVFSAQVLASVYGVKFAEIETHGRRVVTPVL